MVSLEHFLHRINEINTIRYYVIGFNLFQYHATKTYCHQLQKKQGNFVCLVLCTNKYNLHRIISQYYAFYPAARAKNRNILIISIKDQYFRKGNVNKDTKCLVLESVINYECFLVEELEIATPFLLDFMKINIEKVLDF